MKTWMKIALGCLAASVIAVFLFVGGLVAFGFWAKNKVEEVAGGGPAVEEARRTANAIPFAKPSGGVIDEARLLRFIEVRAGIHSVYDKYKGELESRLTRMKESQSFDFSDFSTGLTLMGELQKAEALALAKHGMSEAEYSFIASEVYKSMWTEMGGAEVSKRAVKEAANAAKAAATAMREAGGEGLPAEAREALAQASAEIAASSGDATAQMEHLVTAPENVTLFKKYEADLKKYAMPGLQVLFGSDGPAVKKVP